MPKNIPTPAEMKAAVEAFKKQFTTGFYHGSASNKIKAFDPAKGSKPEEWKTPGVTFVTRDSDFAESFLPGSKNNNYKIGATMYPVSVNLGKHWHPNTNEGKATIQNYLDTTTREYPSKGLLNRADWTEVEHPTFLDHLRNEGYDTFHVVEGGTPNVGVFEPQNIRGKFAKYNPEDAESPDFMKAAGGSIQNFQSGGVSLAKKALEFAKKMPFVHYSTAPNISYLEPGRYGTGIKGAEAARLKDAPDIKPRSYFYVDKGPDTMRPEQGLGPHKYSGMAEDIYPLHEDPAGFSAIAKQKALDPYMMQFGREVVDQPTHLNELERLIKAAGYKGYANDDVGLLFHPTPVTKAE